MGLRGNGRARNTQRGSQHWRHSLTATTMIVGLWGISPAIVPQMAHAQQAAQGVAFNIPAQPLASAIRQFAQQSGFQVTMSGGLLDGLTSSPVTGTLRPTAALAQILGGSGIVWTVIDDQTVALSKANGDQTMLLGPVTIEAGGSPRETAYGPVPGYVATRTATATKSDASILETPQSISVVGSEELQTRNAQTLEDAVKYTPGVHLPYGAAGDARETYVMLRGFSPGYEYVDGLKAMGAWWERSDVYMAERAEVLRGPSSVMYGQNAPGGMVNSVSKRPLAEAKGEVAVEYGSNDWKRVQADVTGPLTEDGVWLYRVTAVAQDSNGLRGYDEDQNNRKLLAPALTWAPQDGTSVTVLALRQEDENTGWRPRMRYRTAHGETEPSTYLGEPDYDSFELIQDKVTVMAEHALSDDLALSVNARYATFDLDYHQIWTGSIAADGQTMNRNAYAYRDSGETIQFDANLQQKLSILSSDHTLTGGVDYSYFSGDFIRGSSATASPINIFNPTYGTIPGIFNTELTHPQVRGLGFYAQDLIRFDDKIFVMLGGRQDMAGSYDDEVYESTFTGRFGIAYKSDFGVVPYASYAESFEPQGGSGWNDEKFQPTTGQQIEIGVKVEPQGLNAVATIAAFDIRKQNVLTTDSDATHVCNGSTCQVQTGEVRSRGVEVGLTMGLAEGLNAVAAYTYNPMDITKSNTPSEIGRQMYDQPIHSASLWMDYSLNAGPLQGFGFGGGLRFIGKTTNAAGTVTTAPQLLDEAMVRYEVDDWRMSLNAKNLFDREIEFNCSTTATAHSCYLQEPLTVTGRLTRSF